MSTKRSEQSSQSQNPAQITSQEIQKGIKDRSSLQRLSLKIRNRLSDPQDRGFIPPLEIYAAIFKSALTDDAFKKTISNPKVKIERQRNYQTLFHELAQVGGIAGAASDPVGKPRELHPSRNSIEEIDRTHELFEQIVKDIRNGIKNGVSIHKELWRDEDYRIFAQLTLGIDENGKDLPSNYFAADNPALRIKVAQQREAIRPQVLAWGAWEKGVLQGHATPIEHYQTIKHFQAEPAQPIFHATPFHEKKYPVSEGSMSFDDFVTLAQSDQGVTEENYTRVLAFAAQVFTDASLTETHKVITALYLFFPQLFTPGKQDSNGERANFFQFVNQWQLQFWNDMRKIGRGEEIPYGTRKHMAAALAYFLESPGLIENSLVNVTLHPHSLEPHKQDSRMTNLTALKNATDATREALDWYEANHNYHTSFMIAEEITVAYTLARQLPEIEQGMRTLVKQAVGTDTAHLLKTLELTISSFREYIDRPFGDLYQSIMESDLHRQYTTDTLAALQAKGPYVAALTSATLAEIAHDHKVHYIPPIDTQEVVVFSETSIPYHLGFDSIIFANSGTDSDWKMDFILNIRDNEYPIRGSITPSMELILEPNLSGEFSGIRDFARYLAVSAFHDLVAQDQKGMALPHAPLEKNTETAEEDDTEKPTRRHRRLVRQGSQQTVRVRKEKELRETLDPQSREEVRVSAHPMRNAGYEAYKEAVAAYLADKNVHGGIASEEATQRLHAARAATKNTSVTKQKTFIPGMDYSTTQDPVLLDEATGNPVVYYSHTWRRGYVTKRLARRQQDQTAIPVREYSPKTSSSRLVRFGAEYAEMFELDTQEDN